MAAYPSGRRFWRWFWSILAATLAGALVLPAVAYLAGKRIIGTYEGQYGVADYVGSIYRGAGQGEPQAFALLLGPLALLGCWTAVVWAWRRLP